jgi:hypothetical protein
MESRGVSSKVSALSSRYHDLSIVHTGLRLFGLFRAEAGCFRQSALRPKRSSARPPPRPRGRDDVLQVQLDVFYSPHATAQSTTPRWITLSRYISTFKGKTWGALSLKEARSESSFTFLCLGVEWMLYNSQSLILCALSEPAALWRRIAPSFLPFTFPRKPPHGLPKTVHGT